MPQTKSLNGSDIAFIYTGIGRGHPYYLDGIIEQIDKLYPYISYYQTDAFSLSKGLSLITWQIVKYLYRFGAKGGIVTRFYSMLRQKSVAGGIQAGMLGLDIKKFFSGYPKPVVVAHPILAAILSKQNRVIYQHGEPAAPVESFIPGCYRILVPVKETALAFENAGISSDCLEITGQCIENNLVYSVKAAYKKRIKRIKSTRHLTVALFSSGAYPPVHIQKLLLAGKSLFTEGHSVTLFMGTSEKAFDTACYFYKKNDLPVSHTIDDTAAITIIHTDNRLEENRLVASIFEKLDFCIAPSHERTNWAVGLGLPLFILCPHIGSYAPLNAAIALKKGVALEIPDNKSAAGIAGTIDTLRKNGELIAMAARGYNHTAINGFSNAVEIVYGMVRNFG